MQDGVPSRDLTGAELDHKHESHASRFGCDDCLGLVARYIAREFEFSADTAESHDAAWYMESVGSDTISLERAADLRTMVIVACHMGAR